MASSPVDVGAYGFSGRGISSVHGDPGTSRGERKRNRGTDSA